MRINAAREECKKNSVKSQPPQRESRARKAEPCGAHASLIRLQQTYGNHRVQQLLRSGLIQPKLNVSEPGDQFEREADNVAEAVMRMPDPEIAAGMTTASEIRTPQISRMCSQCEGEIHRQPLEEEEEKEKETRQVMSVQRVCDECEEKLHREKHNHSNELFSDEAEPQVNEVLGSPGHSLDTEARRFLEPRFGRDFSGVRVHTDNPSAESARAISARAYTFGHHIVFGANQYSPDTDAGRRLLAHELVHVVQQAPHTVARKPLPAASASRPADAIHTRPETASASPEVQMSAAAPRLSVNRFSAQPAIQRDFALEPPHPAAVASVLTQDQMNAALTFNNRVAGRAGDDVIRELRDVLGIDETPAVAGVLVDEDFVNAVVRWQAMQGLTQDGQLGPASAAPLFREIGAENVGECKIKNGPRYVPDGTIAPTVTGINETVHFALRAEFESDPANGFFPSCCEVRQFIRWNAAAVAAFAPGVVPHPGFPAAWPADRWIEDRGDHNDRYGHRSGPHSQPEAADQFLDSTGVRNTPFGERYRGTDDPGGDGLAGMGTWRFMLRVIDVCHGDATVGNEDFIRINW